jgi:hypothetical protein
MVVVKLANSFGVAFGQASAQPYHMPRASRKPGFKQSRQEKIYEMKKIMFVLGLFAFFLGNAQSGPNRICDSELAKFGLQGKTISEVVEYGAKLHNDYQDYVLNQFYLSNPDFSDTSNLKQLIIQKTTEFFAPKGVNTQLDMSIAKLANSNQRDQVYAENNYSLEAKSILIRLKDLMKNYDPNNEAIYFQSLDNLKNLALNLNDEKEVYAIGIPVFVAENSIKYWRQKGQNWLNIFTKEEATEVGIDRGPSNLVLGKKKCDVNFWQLGGADVTGGISGGIGGSVLGVAGIFAGAIVGSSSSSLVNLTNQAMACLFSWWPF